MQSFIVIDTNIFAERTRLLRTGLGPILVYFAKIRATKIFLPQIIEIELRRYAANQIDSLSSEINSATRGMREWLGEAHEPRLPAVIEVTQSIDRRLAELSGWVQTCTSSPELILRAAQRVFQKRAPSHRDGEDAFKDCLIWECILTLPAGTDIDFVTDDVRAFYDPDDPQRLHQSLADEALATGLSIRAHRELGSLIRKLQGAQPDMDRPRAEVALSAALAEPFIHAMQLWNLDALEDGVFSFEAFVTEKPGLLYLEFGVECRASGVVDVEGVRYESPTVRIDGNCLYDPHGPVRDMRVARSSLRASDGRELQATASVYVQGSTSRRRPFQIKRSLKDKGSEAEGAHRQPKQRHRNSNN